MPAEGRLQRPENTYKKFDVGIAPANEPEFQMSPFKTPDYYQQAVATSLRWQKLLERKFPKICGVISYSFDWLPDGAARWAKLFVVIDTSRPQAVAWAEDLLARLPKTWKP